jgi:hypothetical protein
MLDAGLLDRASGSELDGIGSVGGEVVVPSSHCWQCRECSLTHAQSADVDQWRIIEHTWHKKRGPKQHRMPL